MNAYTRCECERREEEGTTKIVKLFRARQHNYYIWEQNTRRMYSFSVCLFYGY